MTKTNAARARQLARSRASLAPANDGPVTELAATAAGPMAFSLGDAEPVLNRRELLEGIECWAVAGVGGRYWQPPLPRDQLSKAMNATAHHASAFRVKVNQLVRDFIPHRLLDTATFEGLALDYLVMGDCFVEQVPNRLSGTAKLQRSLSRYTRRGVDADRFVFLKGWQQEHWFEPGRVLQLMQPSLDQELYGVPEYLSALQSAFLNEGATLFRRRYYINGAHAGFIMYVGEGGLSPEDAEKIKKSVQGTKGVGNFRSMFIHLPDGKRDSIQILHPGEAAAKDEFVGIKNTTRDDVLAAHRVPPQLLGVIPQTAGGFGDVEKAEEVFYRAEVVPLQRRFLPINDWIGEEVVRFRARELKAA
ncbi:MAG: phage portal protein [Caulobacteraceae bacterium]|nr:MAG: phage portal protein [Caulobacteraceae bacterium]